MQQGSNVKVIGVSGQSGSGKSTFAKRLAAALRSPVLPISMDWFFYPPNVPYDPKFGPNWEVPDALEPLAFRRAVQEVQSLLCDIASQKPPQEAALPSLAIDYVDEKKRGVPCSIEIQTPSTRQYEIISPLLCEYAAAHRPTMTYYLVVEGFLLFYFAEVVRMCDYCFFLACSPLTSMRRRYERRMSMLDAAKRDDLDSWKQYYMGLIFEHHKKYLPTQLENVRAHSGPGLYVLDSRTTDIAYTNEVTEAIEAIHGLNERQQQQQHAILQCDAKRQEALLAMNLWDKEEEGEEQAKTLDLFAADDIEAPLRPDSRVHAFLRDAVLNKRAPQDSTPTSSSTSCEMRLVDVVRRIFSITERQLFGGEHSPDFSALQEAIEQFDAVHAASTGAGGKSMERDVTPFIVTAALRYNELFASSPPRGILRILKNAQQHAAQIGSSEVSTASHVADCVHLSQEQCVCLVANFFLCCYPSRTRGGDRKTWLPSTDFEYLLAAHTEHCHTVERETGQRLPFAVAKIRMLLEYFSVMQERCVASSAISGATPQADFMCCRVTLPVDHINLDDLILHNLQAYGTLCDNGYIPAHLQCPQQQQQKEEGCGTAEADDYSDARACKEVALSPITLREPKASIDDQRTRAMLRVDFANKIIGGGSPSFGAVQEEITFTVCPELACARLFCTVMGDYDAILFKGETQFSTIKPGTYSRHLEYGGSHNDSGKCSGSYITAIDAIDYSTSGGVMNDRQYAPAAVVRDVEKAVAGFVAPIIALTAIENAQRAEKAGSVDSKEAVRVKSLRDAADFLLGVPCEIATGNWGCGAFANDCELKFLQQWLAASICRRRIEYFPFDAKTHARLAAFVSTVVEPARRFCTQFDLAEFLTERLDPPSPAHGGALAQFTAHVRCCASLQRMNFLPPHRLSTASGPTQPPTVNYVLILSGALNPIHNEHVHMITAAADKLEGEQVLLQRDNTGGR